MKKKISKNIGSQIFSKSSSVALFLFICSTLFSQNIDMEEVEANEAFRWGVEAYQNGYYNYAIELFEKSLSIKPDKTTPRVWLGKAFYKSGFEEQALYEWNFIAEKGGATSLLKNLIEITSYRRSVSKELETEDRFVKSFEINGRDEDYYPFKKPTSIKSRPDGSFYLVAWGSNEILKLDANTTITDIFSGGLSGFDHPFDILEVENEFFFVSEYSANQIVKCTLSGRKIHTFGGKGTGPGQLLGPQYLAQDEKGYLYVSDFGNQRINKYDFDGNFILSMGERTGSFSGLPAPTGIAVQGDLIYVADKHQKKILIFDLSGNYFDSVENGKLMGPEGLFFGSKDHLLIADANRILELDLKNETILERGDIDSEAARLLNVSIDANGTLVAVDFNLDRVFFLPKVTNLYTGYFTQIERVFSDNFPEVIADISITDRSGRPIVGLKKENFQITEGGIPAQDLELVLSNQNTHPLNIMLLVEKSLSAEKDNRAIEQAVNDIYNLFKDSARIKIVSAGEQATVETGADETRLVLLEAVSKGDYTDYYF